ncbi:MAG: hypothetical protein OQL08_08290 [Gammaproteobacteria bacterium]|nr:hypothetical protein [Gammaproteobacteria bacterium]
MMRIEQRPLAQVAAGEVVAADVVDGQGNMLLGAGGVVNARILEQLARRGVVSLPLLVEVALSAEEVAARRAALEAQLDEQFACVRGQPLMEQLLQTVLRYRLGHA